jgi:hypothetical protein
MAKRHAQLLGRTFDFTVTGEGTVYLLTPKTEAAQDWVEENLPKDATIFGRAIAVEHRYIQSIIGGIAADGLTVSLFLAEHQREDSYQRAVRVEGDI